jgi:hypothetical protein
VNTVELGTVKTMTPALKVELTVGMW